MPAPAPPLPPALALVAPTPPMSFNFSAPFSSGGGASKLGLQLQTQVAVVDVLPRSAGLVLPPGVTELESGEDDLEPGGRPLEEKKEGAITLSEAIRQAGWILVTRSLFLDVNEIYRVELGPPESVPIYSYWCNDLGHVVLKIKSRSYVKVAPPGSSLSSQTLVQAFKDKKEVQEKLFELWVAKFLKKSTQYDMLDENIKGLGALDLKEEVRRGVIIV